MLIDLNSSHKVTNNCNSIVVIIPLGSLEYHGGVLPYNTDTIIASKISEYCLRNCSLNKNECLYLTPTIPIGYSLEWIRYRGTISIDPATYSRLLYSIVNSLEYNLKPHGYVLINAHGGNTCLLESICKKLYFKYNKPFILIDLWRVAESLGLKYCHACLFESRLYSFLTKFESSSINEQFCRENYLEGYYVDYKPGYCGNLDISIEDFLKTLCGLVGKAVDLVCKTRR